MAVLAEKLMMVFCVAALVVMIWTLFCDLNFIPKDPETSSGWRVRDWTVCLSYFLLLFAIKSEQWKPDRLFGGNALKMTMRNNKNIRFLNNWLALRPFLLFTFFIDKKVTKNLVYWSFSVKLIEFFGQHHPDRFCLGLASREALWVAPSASAKNFNILLRKKSYDGCFCFEI